MNYLIDTNCLIEPVRSYFPIEHSPLFWSQMRNALVRDDVFILDKVYNEICRSEDDLKTWLQGLTLKKLRSEQFAGNYRKVIEYISECELYSRAGIDLWASSKTADPWLVAAAMSREGFPLGPELIIITQEKRANPNKNSPSKHIKIPDVAAHFGIKCENVYTFMRIMEFSL